MLESLRLPDPSAVHVAAVVATEILQPPVLAGFHQTGVVPRDVPLREADSIPLVAADRVFVADEMNDDWFRALVVLDRQLPHRGGVAAPVSGRVRAATISLSRLIAGNQPPVPSPSPSTVLRLPGEKGVMDRGPKGPNFHVIAGRADAVREQHADALGKRVTPEARAGEAQVAVGLWARSTARCGCGAGFAIEAGTKAAPRAHLEQRRERAR